MPRLAVVIRAVGSIESLESTLVSVLENRPADCEILVALDKPYSDPYELKDEVRFIQGARRSGPTACINQALAATRAPIVHLLASGCTVTEGWTQAPLARFGDRKIGSVAPLVMDAQDPVRIFAAGLGYRSSGRRLLVGRGQAELSSEASASIIGACGFAAFYRKAALDLVGGLSTALGPAQADVDVARALAKAGFTVALERQSRVLALAEADAREGAFRQALHEERLFWRNLPQSGKTGALVAHAALVAWELARNFPRPAMLWQLAARTWGCCQIGSYARHYAVQEKRGQPGAPAGTQHDRLRVDAAHQAQSLPNSANVRAPAR